MLNFNRLTIDQKWIVGLAILSFVISTLGLVLSDNVFRLIASTKLIITQENQSLLPVVNTDNRLTTLQVKNIGAQNSNKTAIIFKFDKEPKKYNVWTDEVILNKIAKYQTIKVNLERLASGSSIFMSYVSNDITFLGATYIDSDGKAIIEFGNDNALVEYWDILWVIFLIVSLTIILSYIYRAQINYFSEKLKASNSEILNKIEGLTQALQVEETPMANSEDDLLTTIKETKEMLDKFNSGSE